MLLVKGQGGTLFACTALSFTIDFWEKTPLTNLVSLDNKIGLRYEHIAVSALMRTGFFNIRDPCTGN